MAHPAFAPEILEFYAAGLEQDRLTAPHRAIEYWRTMDILGRHLPKQPAIVYDVGGGPGRYALALASAGHQVHLLDPVPLHTEQALAASKESEHPLASVQLGDARALPYETHSADVVLLLGPLYHLTTTADRERAWAEAVRVLKPGGTVIAVGASRFYTGWQMLSQNLLDLPGADDQLQEHLATGQHRNPDRDVERWTTAYFHTPRGLADEAHGAGLTVRALLAVEGPAKLLPNLAEQMTTDTGREQVLAAIRRTETEPSTLGLSSHILVVADVPAKESVTPARTSELIRAVSGWIDTAPSNADRPREALLWGRVAKVCEEAGEVVAALVGATGQNPARGSPTRCRTSSGNSSTPP